MHSYTRARFQTDVGVDESSSASHHPTQMSPAGSTGTLTLSSGGSYRGEIVVALKFVPPPSAGKHRSGSNPGGGSSSSRRARGMLMVLIKEAKNLVPAARGAATADPFCKW